MNTAHDVARAALEWIDALPADVVAALPTMPGFVREVAENILAEARTEQPVGWPEKVQWSLGGEWSQAQCFGWNLAIDECRAVILPAPAPVTVKLPERYDIQEMSRNPWESYRCIEPDEDGEYLKRDDVLAMLHGVGIKIAEGE